MPPLTLVLIAALGVALLVALVSLAALSRARRRADRRVDEAVRRATEAFQETLRLDPNHQSAKHNLALLDSLRPSEGEASYMVR